MEDPWADSSVGASQSSVSQSQGDDAAPASNTSAPSALSAQSAGRPSRLTPRRLVAQPTRLQSVEDDPLGPLGASAPTTSDGSLPPLAPPVPPVKEQLPLRTTLSGSGNTLKRSGPPDPHRIDDDDGYGQPSGPRHPPPVQPAQPSPIRSSMQPSVSVEQASKPSFQITVGDPHKVGDLTSSHIVYSVRTKVREPQPIYLVRLDTNYLTTI